MKTLFLLLSFISFPSFSAEIPIEGYTGVDIEFFSKILSEKKMIVSATVSDDFVEDWKNHVPFTSLKKYYINVEIELKNSKKIDIKCGVFIDKFAEELTLMNCGNENVVLLDKRIKKKFYKLGIKKNTSARRRIDMRTKIN